VPVAYSLSIGGLTFGDVAQVSDGQAFKHGSAQSISGPGGVSLPAWRGDNAIRVRGELNEADLLAIRDKAADLDQMFSNNNLAKLILHDDNRFRQVRVVSRRFLRNAQRLPTRLVPYELELLSMDPFWYAAAESSKATQSITVSPTTFSVTNGGNEKTPCKIVVTAIGADRTGIRITNATTGETWKYTTAIIQNTALTVDSRQRTAKYQGKEKLGDLEGFFWDLAVGNNDIKCEGDVDFDVDVSWHERYGG